MKEFRRASAKGFACDRSGLMAIDIRAAANAGTTSQGQLRLQSIRVSAYIVSVYSNDIEIFILIE